MNQRLQQFLDLENISPAKLSEILNVQRSNISHILNGRNKPSYEFICRMLSKFPSLNADWLLTGRGKPYKESFPPTFETGRLTDNESNRHIVAAEKGNGLSALNDYDTASKDTTSHQNENEDDTLPDNHRELSENLKITDAGMVIRENRKVKSVVIFYDDGSFDELKPEK